MHQEKRSRCGIRLPNRNLPGASCIAIACLLLLIGACSTPLQHESRKLGSTELDAYDDPEMVSDSPAAAGDSLPASTTTGPLLESEGADSLPHQSDPQDAADSHADVQQESVSDAATTASFAEPVDSTLLDESAELEVDQGLTVPQVLQHALECHPLLRAREHEVEVARARLITAGLLPNPRLVMDTESPVHESDPTDLTTRVEFTIPFGGKLRRRKAVARAGIQRAQLALGLETEQVLLEAGDAAVEVLYLQELLAQQEQLSDLADREASVLQSRFEAMAVSIADKVRADLTAADCALARLDTAAKLEVARLTLSRAMGLPTPGPVRMKGRLAADPIVCMPLETVLATAREVRPELADARVAVTESRRQVALARAEACPDVVMGPRYQDPLGVDDDQIGVRFNMDLPLFDRNQGSISERAAEVRASHAMLAATEITSLGDVASAYQELLALQSLLDYYDRDVLPLDARAESMIRDYLTTQALSEDQALDLLQRLIRTRINHLQLRYRFAQLRIRLELFLGCPLAELPAEPEMIPAGPPVSMSDIGPIDVTPK